MLCYTIQAFCSLFNIAPQLRVLYKIHVVFVGERLIVQV